MSVYTPIESNTLIEFLATYAVGELTEYQGISAGIENTNYFVTTTEGRYVLTIFEKLSHKELPYFLNLMAHLAQSGVPCARPIANRQGSLLANVKNKPTTLVQRLEGGSIDTPTPDHCRQLGMALAKLHKAGQSFRGHRDNDRGLKWWRKTAKKLDHHVNSEDWRLITREIDYQAKKNLEHLPHGITHADLFRDNALFVQEQLTGIIDFYYACNNILLYDLAVAVNDWCRTPDYKIDPQRLRHLTAAYHQIRPLEPVEKGAWAIVLRAAALRFWLSRLHDATFPRPGEMTHIKDPDVFRNLLLFHLEHRERWDDFAS